jgi:hypothetical protein
MLVSEANATESSIARGSSGKRFGIKPTAYGWHFGPDYCRGGFGSRAGFYFQFGESVGNSIWHDARRTRRGRCAARSFRSTGGSAASRKSGGANRSVTAASGAGNRANQRGPIAAGTCRGVSRAQSAGARGAAAKRRRGNSARRGTESRANSLAGSKSMGGRRAGGFGGCPPHSYVSGRAHSGGDFVAGNQPARCLPQFSGSTTDEPDCGGVLQQHELLAIRPGGQPARA